MARFRVMVGRIAAIAVVIAIGVVLRIHRWHVMRVARTAARRWHRRTEAVIVVAVGTWTVVVARARTDLDHYPWLVVVAVPAEAQWLEVFECSEAEELVIQFVIRHHRVCPRRIRTEGRDADGNSLDTAGAHSHPFLGIAIAVIGIEVDIDITFVGVVSNILHIIVEGNRIGVVGQHGL